ncbi:MAG: GPW/gp25 family protein [Crocinitomicaceae bacterium]|nr:GPW/gp25 family protein [Crocinitomicaceae bacterium]
MSRYYRFPLDMGAVIQKKDLAATDLDKSIAQNIYLILTTEFGEYRYDESFGCSIWDHDFENIVSVHAWKDQIAQSVKLSVLKHEPRLSNVRVKVEIGQEEKALISKKTISRLKKCIDVTVSGNFVDTNQPFSPYTQRLYISPFSFD